jgi:hypothetical protein
MKVQLWLPIFFLVGLSGQAQQFEVTYSHEVLKATIGESIQAPVRIRNNDSKPITLILKKLPSDLGSTQKSFFCIDKYCTYPGTDELVIRLEPGQTIADVVVTIEAGLSAGTSTSYYSISSKNNPASTTDFEFTFTVEDVPERKSVYHSKYLTLHDVYPNPAVEFAQIDYKIHELKPVYSIVVRNLLGNIVGQYKLISDESRLKIRTDELTPGIYFFTLYIGNDGVVTRKMMVKR